MVQKQRQIYVPISRIDEEERMVYGYGTRGDIVDSYGTIIDLERVKEILPDYAKWRNIREMHQLSAVGTADVLEADDTGVYLGAKIVDDVAWEKVRTEVYKGFSIGGKEDYTKDGIVFLKSITEFSLVDRPSNEGCTIDQYRIHGGDMERTPEQMAVVDGDIRRYAGEEIYDCQTALYALSNISYLLDKEQGEDHPEAAEQAAALKVAILKLKEFVASEIKESSEGWTPGPISLELADHPNVTRTLELVQAAMALDDADPIGASIKAAFVARTAEFGFSQVVAPSPEVIPPQEEIAAERAEQTDGNIERKKATSKERAQIIHDHSTEMGAKCAECSRCGTTNKADEADIIRAEEATAAGAILEGDIIRAEGQENIDWFRVAMNTAKRRGEAEVEIERLKAIPAGPGGEEGAAVISRVIAKEADDSTTPKEIKRIEDTPEYKGATEEQQAFLLARAALRQPMIIRGSVKDAQPLFTKEV